MIREIEQVLEVAAVVLVVVGLRGLFLYFKPYRPCRWCRPGRLIGGSLPGRIVGYVTGRKPKRKRRRRGCWRCKGKKITRRWGAWHMHKAKESLAQAWAERGDE